MTPLPHVRDAQRQAAGLFLLIPVVVLACGHMLSNLLRTLPAVAVDVMAADIGASPQTLASLTGAYYFAFAAGQLPVGAALDWLGVRTVAMWLLAGTCAGAALAALAADPGTFLLAQLLLGLATAGMLMCPMTLAARRLPPARFGLWSGLILSLGNMGMVLSASPLAWLIENWGWRAGFWASGALAIAIAAAVAACVPNDRPASSRGTLLILEMVQVVRLGASPALRGILLIALVSFAFVLVLRGLWGGPWLMEVKGLSRIEAGNVLALFTVSLIVGPLLGGILDRKLGRRRGLIVTAHLTAAGLLLAIAGGGPGGPLSNALGLERVPAHYDAAMLALAGLVISVQPLLYALARQSVPVEDAGKTLSAVNLAFFLGAAVIQAASGPVAVWWGVGAVFVMLAALAAAGTLAFLACSRPPPADRA